MNKALRSELMYAAAAANAWLRGLSIPTVALHYRYEPVTALRLIRRCCAQYGAVNVERCVPAHILSCASAQDNGAGPAQSSEGLTRRAWVVLCLKPATRSQGWLSR